MMSGEGTLQLSVTARSGSFRRAGIAFGKEPVLVSIGRDQAELFLTLVRERELLCQARFSEDDDFALITDADADQIEIGLKLFMTGTGEEGGEDSQAPLDPNLASDAAAATGDDASQTATEAATPSSGEEQPAADAAPAPVAAQTTDSVNPTEAAGDDAKGAAVTSIGDDRNDDVEKPGADAAAAPVASTEPEKPSGRAPKAAKPKASEAKAAS